MSCGFTDVRRDAKGYYCTKCGWRPLHNFYECLPTDLRQKLDEQCRGDNRDHPRRETRAAGKDRENPN